MLLNVQNISKYFLDELIFSDVSLQIEQGARIGLLGPNGAGKTTLLNIISGQLQPDAGSIVRAKGLRIGYLRQNDALVGTRSLNEEIRDAFAQVDELKAQMDETALALQSRPNDAALLAEYDRLLARFEAQEGYRTDEKIERVLTGLGFAHFDRESLVSTLSGGEKMRFAFAKLLLSSPDLLMLDEPTNHLDFSMLGWLEGYLSTYKGAVVTVSHDRYFLDAVAKNMCEMERGRLSHYKGGYTSFVQQKAERQLTAMRAWEKQQEEIAKMQDYVRRNIARASTSKMAQSRQKTLDKMEILQRPSSADKSVKFRFEQDIEPFSCVLQCEALSVSVGQGERARTLYKDICLEVMRGEKIALVGLNGVGKSTFIKAIQNIVAHTGAARWGGNVRIGYFDQELAGLDMDATVIEAVHRRYPAKTEFEIRSALGALLLEGEAVFKKVSQLSGAQRAKVAFAILQMRRANVLLLDEPTNHLDYRAKEVLEESLIKFSGTIIVVSHDRYFLRRVPSAILEMRPEGFVRTEGNYDNYIQSSSLLLTAQKPGQAVQDTAQAAQESTQSASEEAKGGAYRSKQQRAQDAQKRQRISTLEAQISKLEAEIEHHNTQLTSPENMGDYEALAQHSRALEGLNEQLNTAMDEWVDATEE